MNKIQKRLAMLLAGALLTGTVLSGCGGSAAQPSVKEEKKTLVVGIGKELPPYAYEKDGKSLGIDAEVAAAIAEKLGMQLKIVTMDETSLLAAAESGKVDMGMSEIVADKVAKKQAETLSFTDPYATDEQSILVRKEASAASNAVKAIAITGPKELKGHTIGVKRATTGQLYCEKQFGKQLVKVYETGTAAVAALEKGQVEAVVLDSALAKSLAEERKTLKLLSEKCVEVDYTIAVSAKNTELFDKINGAVGDLIDEGKAQKIMDKYTGPEVTAKTAQQ